MVKSPQKMARSVCGFYRNVNSDSMKEVGEWSDQLRKVGFEVQTERVVTRDISFSELESRVDRADAFLGLGSVPFDAAQKFLADFAASKRISFHVDLTNESIAIDHVNWLCALMSQCPDRMFRFAFCFSNPPSAPYFPSAKYEREGFSIGVQPTDLASDCHTFDQWLDAMKRAWQDILELFGDDARFLGIDSSVAPMGCGPGSLAGIAKRFLGSFEAAVLSDFFLKITRFIKEENPKPVGLCGLMLPCLEDEQLADLYEEGRFSIERNLFLSLHSGLGIDTYPIGIDEDQASVLSILKLVQGLSLKYQKPFSIRFVSDGKAKIGQKTNFQNPYMKDVVIRSLKAC